MQTAFLIKIMEKKVFSEHKDKTSSHRTWCLLQGWKVPIYCALLHVEPIINYAIDCFLFSNLLQKFLSLSHLFAAIIKHEMTTGDPLLTAQLNFLFIRKKKYMLYSRYWGFGFF